MVAEDKLDTYNFNNAIVGLRPVIRQVRVHTIKHLTRAAKKYRDKKTKNKEESEKNIRRADRLVKEVMVIKTLHDDDISKFALLNTKKFAVVGNNPQSSDEERALCRITDHKILFTAVKGFREKYKNWTSEVPQAIKVLGLRHRKKKLKRLVDKGTLQTYLIRERKVLHLLHDLAGLEVDEKLLNASVEAIEQEILNPKEGNPNKEEIQLKISDPESLEVDERLLKTPVDLKDIDEGNVKLDKDKVTKELNTLKKHNAFFNKVDKKLLKPTIDLINIDNRNLKTDEDEVAEKSVELLKSESVDKADESNENYDSGTSSETETGKLVRSDSEDTKSCENSNLSVNNKLVKECKSDFSPKEIKSNVELDSETEDFFQRDPKRNPNKKGKKTSFFLGREGQGESEDDSNSEVDDGTAFDSSRYFRRKRFRGEDDNNDGENKGSFRGRSSGSFRGNTRAGHNSNRSFDRNVIKDGYQSYDRAEENSNDNDRNRGHRHENFDRRKPTQFKPKGRRMNQSNGFADNANMIPLGEKREGMYPKPIAKVIPERPTSMHPSWEAKRKQVNQAASLSSFKGTRTTFDD